MVAITITELSRLHGPEWMREAMLVGGVVVDGRNRPGDGETGRKRPHAGPSCTITTNAFSSAWRIRIGYLRFLVRPLAMVRCLEEKKNLALANSGACSAITAWRSFASYCDHYGPSVFCPR
ncbi:uncharacterized protein N7496_000300 [Penicillium cataractarum]|uniref:Uncharacterized protein n=1 Tax=Penicillium cataractarum TaxID=2100454 RepID=A0A9W9VTT0_9EURO|nr:uncharacterized protein N7496_000300 [Penicillium cataractarum]KAJ5389232.1 hypothetical protein N7496_000300 [Penicillium cataractarum]